MGLLIIGVSIVCWSCIDVPVQFVRLCDMAVWKCDHASHMNALTSADRGAAPVRANGATTDDVSRFKVKDPYERGVSRARPGV